jgi:hypothetical protein
VHLLLQARREFNNPSFLNAQHRRGTRMMHAGFFDGEQYMPEFHIERYKNERCCT